MTTRYRNLLSTSIATLAVSIGACAALTASDASAKGQRSFGRCINPLGGRSMSKFGISKFGLVAFAVAVGASIAATPASAQANRTQANRTQIGNVTLLNGASRIPAGVRSANTTMTNYGYRASNMQPSPTGLIRTGTVVVGANRPFVVGANPALAAYRIGPQHQFRTQPMQFRR